ncbi:hypothetical protein HDU80_003702, partial [Chytriomyces hyalinus]
IGSHPAVLIKSRGHINEMDLRFLIPAQSYADELVINAHIPPMGESEVFLESPPGCVGLQTELANINIYISPMRGSETQLRITT